jgi:hypothetical protein
MPVEFVLYLASGSLTPCQQGRSQIESNEECQVWWRAVASASSFPVLPGAIPMIYELS